MKYLKEFLMKIYLNHTSRLGHEPGAVDVSTMNPGQPFTATPNFRYFAKGRPCWLPINPEPKLGDGTGTWPVTKNWPCEFYSLHLPLYGLAGLSWQYRSGDKLKVVGQVRGPVITNDIGVTSNIWDVVLIPYGRVVRNAENLADFDDDGIPLGFVPDMWLGNTGWHDIPYRWPL